MEHSKRTTLHSHRGEFSTMELIHATAGIEPAGAGTRERVREGWLVQFKPHSGGAPSGQWYPSLEAAKHDFDLRIEIRERASKVAGFDGRVC